jgi:3-hydroxyacyl-[acyl-carrier-protein] dehydratase
MRFQLIDRIEQWESGKSLQASKFLALGEEYLADHFPRFPVMPGVLMLEALVESAAWLWRITSNYHYPVIVLREVRNVKYGTFMQPGRKMDLSVELVKIDGSFATFRGKGTNDAGETTVNAQFVLLGHGLADRGPAGVIAEQKLQQHWAERWVLLTGGLKSRAASTAG